MKNIEKIKLYPDATIEEALKVIDRGAKKIAFIVGNDNILLGTISDGDIRRAILNGSSLESSIEHLYSKDPIVVSINDSKETIIAKCVDHNIHQLPVVDTQNRVIDIVVLDQILKPKIHLNKVVLMVGGLGVRLRPLTEKIPKPMLPVGEKPILHTIVEMFSSQGFVHIFMCVNYKSHVIQDYFGDGGDFGVKIEYIQEEKRMGTAGALRLLVDRLDSETPFFVMNGDLLTHLNFDQLLKYHLEKKSIATMCVREYDFQVPYGVVEVKNHEIESIKEKPIYKYFVNAGIYILNKECINYIPDEFYDMPQLFEQLIASNKKAISFPLRECWIDIGRLEEYQEANKNYLEEF